MKNYLILSDDSVIVNEELKKIIKENNLSSDNIIKYDMSNTSLNYVIDELNTYGLFYPNKVVVISNCSFLTSEKKRGDIAQDESLLEDYINNPNQVNSLVIVCEKLDERKKLTKLLKNKCVVINGIISIDKKIKSILAGYEVDQKTISFLIDYLHNDNLRILNEVRKLKLYKLEEKIITIDDIKTIVVKDLDDDIFSLVNAIVNKNIKKSFEIYQNLLARGEEITKIIITTCDQFRLIYKVKILVNEGNSKETIANMLKIHPYRVKLAIEASYNFSKNDLLRYLDSLANLDINIKTGKSANNYGFDIFLINL